MDETASKSMTMDTSTSENASIVRTPFDLFPSRIPIGQYHDRSTECIALCSAGIHGIKQIHESDSTHKFREPWKRSVPAPEIALLMLSATIGIDE